MPESEKGNSEGFKSTALKTDKDLHDDPLRPPTKDSFYGEVQMQCTALFFQTAFDDKETFERTAKYFLKDLLEWYGVRNETIGANDVEKFFIPVAVVISRQIGNVMEISKAVTEYVCDIASIDSMSDPEKEAAVQDGFSAFVLACTVCIYRRQDIHRINGIAALNRFFRFFLHIDTTGKNAFGKFGDMAQRRNDLTVQTFQFLLKIHDFLMVNWDAANRKGLPKYPFFPALPIGASYAEKRMFTARVTILFFVFMSL
jgi:hypothetical protein